MNPDLIYLSKQLQDAANLASKMPFRGAAGNSDRLCDCIQRARDALERIIEAERAKQKEAV